MSDLKDKFLNTFSKFKVSKHIKLAVALPLLIIIVAVAVIIGIGETGGSYTNAVGIGIDFEGGTVLTVVLGEDALDDYDANVQAIKSEIEKHGVVVSYIQRQETSDESQTAITFRYKNISDDDTSINELNDAIKESVDELYADSGIENFEITYESIGATAASDLLSKSAIALSVSLVLILIYIVIRFTFVSGVAAVISMLHDVIIMFALTVICRIQINTSFVAALITIVAYSLNNTIIIFDRCREYLKPLKGQKNIDYVSIGDTSVRENMTRTVYTTLTTMVIVVLLAAFGGGTMSEFCVPIILGLISGFYSSVFIATPLWSSLSFSFDKFKEKHFRKAAVSYDKDDDIPKEKTAEKAEGGKVQKEVAPKPKPANKKSVYKYSKKNTTFKKK
jgi:preprotein translocase subunit SecF